MQDILIVVDMQNDFIDGTLGTKEAVGIVPEVVDKVKAFLAESHAEGGTENADTVGDGATNKIIKKLIFTRDTHYDNYLETQEGKNLPVKHCIRGENGWNICNELEAFANNTNTDASANNTNVNISENNIEVLTFDKLTFGSRELGEYLAEQNKADTINSITLVGLCTDICVISNALLIKAFLTETEVIVDAKCCAGVTPDSHKTALEAMKMCQIKVINE